MDIRKNHTHALRALFLLLVFITACEGKSLHTHSEEYYGARQSASGDRAGGIVDDCPLCHFQLAGSLPASGIVLTVFFILLSAIVVRTVLSGSQSRPQRALLRAPPFGA